MKLRRAVVEMMGRPTVLVGLDFDGVIAPIVAHPDLAVPDPRALASIRELADRPAVDVLILSGRSLEDLKERVGDLHGVLMVGEHGNDTGTATDLDPRVQEIRDFFDSLSRETPEATIERKQRSGAFHTRGLPGELAADLSARIRAWAEQHETIELLEGKEVLELSVGAKNKGDVIVELGQGCDGIVYIGDDVTDETVFTQLGDTGLTVKVGEGATAARFRVADVGEVVALLEWMALASG